MKLFKYYSDSINSFKSLAVRGLWCHYPSKMNDPFECLAFVERELSDSKIESIKKQFKNTSNPTIRKILNFTNEAFREFAIKSRIETINKW